MEMIQRSLASDEQHQQMSIINIHFAYKNVECCVLYNSVFGDSL